MSLGRRTVLIAATALAMPLAVMSRARAATADPRMGERALGRADAKVTAQE